MTVFMFPGQGSQKRGMGEELFDSVAEYRSVESEVDTIVGYSMRDLCINDSDNRLSLTQYTQPSLYVVNALHYYKALQDGLRPSFVAGHSLGEYNALLAAGVFDFVTGLRLVVKRGELMSRASGGGMAAVIGLDSTSILDVIAVHGLAGIDVANFNSPTQTVLSGPTDDIRRAAGLFESAGAQMYVQLPVSAAFHSRYVAEAAQSFSDYLASFSFAAPRRTVIANVTGLPYESSGAEVSKTLVRQITSPVRWTRSIEYLLEQGEGAADFVEVGPGNVLTRLFKQIESSPQAVTARRCVEQGLLRAG